MGMNDDRLDRTDLLIKYASGEPKGNELLKDTNFEITESGALVLIDWHTERDVRVIAHGRWREILVEYTEAPEEDRPALDVVRQISDAVKSPLP